MFPHKSVTFLRPRKICNYERLLDDTGLDMIHKEINNNSKVALGWISEGHKKKGRALAYPRPTWWRTQRQNSRI